MRVGLRRYLGDLVNVTLTLTVPNDAEPGSSGILFVTGGAGEGFFPTDDVSSFGQLLNALANTPKNSDLVADMLLFPFDGEPTETSVEQSLDSVISGSVEIGVEVQ